MAALMFSGENGTPMTRPPILKTLDEIRDGWFQIRDGWSAPWKTFEILLVVFILLGATFLYYYLTGDLEPPRLSNLA